MSNTVDDILSKAQLAYDNHNYKYAIELLEDVYLNHKNFHNNYFLFKSFIKIRRWDLAVNIANDFLLNYVQNDEYFFQYFECMLHSGDIFGSVVFFNKIEPYLNSFEFDCLKQKLKHYSSYLSKEQQKERDEVIHSLKYLGGYSIYKQQQILRNLKLLFPDELLLESSSALLDPDVPCIVRMSIINVLRKVKHGQVKVLNLFLEPVEIELEKLNSIENMLIFKKIKSRILSSNKINEALKPRVIHEIKLKLIVMYSEIEKLDEKIIFQIIFGNNEKKSKIVKKFQRSIVSEIDKINDFKNY